ncbi:hypothetical protein [Streptomyces sp. BE133]|uniref:hypothetical protein n=1 Tax=Streptomyces sp. BE133 TaxID=3002523 RepID=UPI002E787202|nr:hypothetical protein [Streptomyces sp. BE133]MEE1806416.1 hypothetical protein [Streptomyces sp. BE133]
MNAPPRSPLKSLPARPTGPGIAEPAPAASGSGAPKVVGRKAVPIAVRPDPRTTTVHGIRPGLHILGLDRGEIPVADWLCTCGHHERARGRKAVTELNTRVRVGHCPHRAPAQNRSAA